MATGDVVTVRGSYATVQAAASTADGAVCGGSRTNIGAALAADVEDYPLLDFKVTVSVGTPTVNTTVAIYRIPDDGTNAAPTTTATYKQVLVGTVTLIGSAPSQYYYLYGVPNVDQNDESLMINNGGATLTIALAARGRTVNTAT